MGTTNLFRVSPTYTTKWPLGTILDVSGDKRIRLTIRLALNKRIPITSTSTKAIVQCAWWGKMIAVLRRFEER